MKLALLILFAGLLSAQQQTRWSATTGNVSQSGATYAATIQQPASNQQQVYLDQIVVYCSVACTVTQSANGTPATVTAGTITPLLPSQFTAPLSVTFFTASDVGAGTQQGGILNLAAGATVVLCLGTSCNNPAQITLPTGGAKSNYSVTISAITGTSNITFYGRSAQ